ncbi:MAG: hypothetical protein ACXW0F_11900 [Gaiellaceae bacterium]
MRRRTLIGLVSALAASVVLAAGTTQSAEGGLIGTGAASGCDAAASHPFEAWGDNANYLLMPGGSFEEGGPDWSLSRGAYVGPGNSPFETERDNGTRSLYLLPGATATSPTGCFKFGDWHSRFFVRGIGTRTARVEVDVVVRSLLGILTVLDGGSVSASAEWQPSPQIGMLLCNVTSLLGTKAVSLRFRAVNGAFQIDDVYLDPWKDS